MNIKPLNVLGAEVSNVDLKALSGKSSVQEIQDAIDKYKVLFFRDQNLDGDELTNLAKEFGPPFVQPALSEKYQDLLVIETNSEKPPYLNTFHQDMTGLEEPPALFFLEGVIIPDSGGDTIWSCNETAYESLSTSMKEFLNTLNCKHSLLYYYEPIFSKWEHGQEKKLEFQKDFPPISHPLVRTHPHTGKKCLFVNKFFTESVEGLEEDESKALLSFLYGVIEKPEFCVRLKWESGTIAVWDNRCTSHYAVADYYPETRRLQRAAVAGEKVS